MLIKQESWALKFFKKQSKEFYHLCGMQNGAKSKYTLKYTE